MKTTVLYELSRYDIKQAILKYICADEDCIVDEMKVTMVDDDNYIIHTDLCNNNDNDVTAFIKVKYND